MSFLMPPLDKSLAVGDDGKLKVVGATEINKNKPLIFWVGTQAEYDAIKTKDPNTNYMITDDSRLEEMLAWYEEVLGKKQTVPIAQEARQIVCPADFRLVYTLYYKGQSLATPFIGRGLYLFNVTNLESSRSISATTLMWIPNAGTFADEHVIYSQPLKVGAGDFRNVMLKYDMEADTITVVEVANPYTSTVHDYSISYMCIGDIPYTLY